LTHQSVNLARDRKLLIPETPFCLRHGVFKVMVTAAGLSDFVDEPDLFK